MPRRRARRAEAAVLRDLRQANVTIEPASSTTNDQPLTDSDVAPEASPAQTKSKTAKAPSKPKAKA